MADKGYHCHGQQFKASDQCRYPELVEPCGLAMCTGSDTKTWRPQDGQVIGTPGS